MTVANVGWDLQAYSGGHVAPIDDLAAKLRSRCDGAIDRLLLGFGKTVPAAKVAEIVHELRTP